MFSFQLINHPESFLIDADRITEICKYIASAVNISQNGTLNIAFLSDEAIRTLNNQYRGIDNTTDVLSFHYFADFSSVSVTDIAGEIIMSESRIILQARDHGHSPTQETEVLIIHGMLHILGYDHEDESDYRDMWEIEKRVREAFILTV